MLNTQKISCQRGRQLLWSDVNLTVDPGQLLFVSGANGSGKSSLLRILAGLSSPNSGDIFWCGEKITVDTIMYRSQLLYIGHQPPLNPELNAIENLIFLTQLHGQKVGQDQMVSALQFWELQGKTITLPTKHLSQGQKQRVALAQLSLLEKKLWILDEPFNSLDSSGSNIISKQLEQHLAQDHLAVITSHLHELPNISIIKDKNLRIYHIHIEIIDDKIIYERKLKEGQGSNIYGIDVCGSLDMPNEFIKNAEIVRKEILGIDINLMNIKKSNYKSSIFMDLCQICNQRPAKETHHINYQINASENGKFSNFDKNIKHNLINVCEECHLKEHNGEIGIIGYKQTSKGIVIEIDKKARIYKLIKRGKHNWFMRKKINDKYKAVEDNEIIEFYNKQVKSNIKEISVEMERDFFDISL
jgi:heme exporter protein A